MEGLVRAYAPADLEAVRAIWNTVVKEGVAYPQEQPLRPAEAERFFAAQSHVGVYELAGEAVGFYILHPNNEGRCGHIANASYAVRPELRGRHVGEALVRDSITVGAALGFRLLQFNAVVASNAGAIHLYTKLGFHKLGTVPGGFRLDDGRFEDIILFYRELP